MHPAMSERDTTLKNVRDVTLLALRMRAGDHKPRNVGSLQKVGTNPSERNTALLMLNFSQ